MAAKNAGAKPAAIIIGIYAFIIIAAMWRSHREDQAEKQRDAEFYSQLSAIYSGSDYGYGYGGATYGSLGQPGQVHVSPYLRADGTFVPGHYRTAPDSTTLNNWSRYPNVNPHTGARGSRHR